MPRAAATRLAPAAARDRVRRGTLGRVARSTVRVTASTGPFSQGEVVSSTAEPRKTYRVGTLLGAGSSSHTYLAFPMDAADAAPQATPADAAQPPPVALKAMSLRGQGRWKAVELFEREARLLKGLQHPGVPALLDCFEIDTATDRTYVLVQQLAPGSTLQELVDRGTWRPDEAEIEAIALQLLDVVAYLHARRPAVIHRDIKPSNLVYDPATRALALVDFGAVRDALNDGSTVVGTLGYMPLEQFTGRTSTASDVYSVGATLLFLLSGRPPSDLPQNGLRVDWERAVSAGPRMRMLLSGLLELEAEQRITAAQAIAVLRGETRLAARPSAVPASAVAGPRRRPAGSRVVVERDGEALRVTIPPAGVTGETLSQGAFTAAWLGIIGLWTATAITGGAPLLFTAFSAPFWAVGGKLVRDTVSPTVVATELCIERDSWRLTARARGVSLRTLEGQAADLDAVRPVAEGAGLELLEGVRTHRFGEALQPSEAAWVEAEVNAFLRERVSAALPPPAWDE